MIFDKENKTWKNLKENVHDFDLQGDEKNLEHAMRLSEDPYGTGIFFRDKQRLHYQEILQNLN